MRVCIKPVPLAILRNIYDIPEVLYNMTDEPQTLEIDRYGVRHDTQPRLAAGFKAGQQTADSCDRVRRSVWAGQGGGMEPPIRLCRHSIKPCSTTPDLYDCAIMTLNYFDFLYM